jgi:hypothetical protein
MRSLLYVHISTQWVELINRDQVGILLIALKLWLGILWYVSLPCGADG